MSTTPNYDINYDDKRFTEVETDKEEALTDVEEMYGGMIDQSDAFYDKQIQAAKDYEKKQTEIQNQQTEFAIEKIEQQKEQTKKDYTKEQSGAYVDWQKQSNQYGADAEQKAAQGMTNTGYSESSQVSMYNTYQNRITTARESFNLAILNYNNAIKDARLQNSAALAEIAYQSLQKQLELSLAGFQYKNALVTELASKKREIDNEYNDRYQDVLNQINTENALAEEVRQYNKSLEMEQAKLAEEKRQFDILHPATTGGTVKGGGGNNKGSGSNKVSTASVNPNRTSIKEKSLNKTPLKQTVDMNSVLALGYGPISAAKLDQLVGEGKVKKYTDGNKIKFVNAVSLKNRFK